MIEKEDFVKNVSDIRRAAQPKTRAAADNLDSHSQNHQKKDEFTTLKKN